MSKRDPARTASSPPQERSTRGKPRQFAIRPAKRSAIALRIGLIGPSGAGKTFSALRLATGITAATGGDIIMLDTENHQARHYADQFAFRHMDIAPPFGSSDYCAALEAALAQKPGVIIIDSMSHEHEGDGGLLDAHDQELFRLAGEDPAAALRYQSFAWRKPKAERRALLAQLRGANCHIIFCFRAAERTRAPRDETTPPRDMGFTAITGPEFLYQLTCSALLHPGSGGVPTWSSPLPGEASAIKRPAHLSDILRPDHELSEETGHALAVWARAPGSVGPATPSKPARKKPTARQRPCKTTGPTAMARVAPRSRVIEERPTQSSAARSKVATI